MSMKTLADAFYEELRDTLSAEKQLTKALIKMAKKATSTDLKKAFESHQKETIKHVERVEAAFDETGKAARVKKCEAMAGLIKEGEELMKEDAEDEVMDALLIASAQKVEHYEIASYGTLCTWADLLGYTKAKSLLGKNMEQEEEADQKLTQLSQELNAAAQAANGDAMTTAKKSSRYDTNHSAGA